MHLRCFIALPLLSLAWACGGQSLNDPDDGDSGAGGDSGKGGSSASGGSASGGTSGDGSGGSSGTATGGSSSGGTGGSNSGGTGAGANGGSGTCLAFPTCAPDETQISGPEYCVAGGVCHQVSICGATIWCTGKARCDPATEPNRAYLLDTCAPGDGWTCPLNTTSFVNECGCGCEQDPRCPSYFYCSGLPARTLPTPAPGSAGTSGGQSAAPLPYCDPAELARCPYSEVLP